ncbi:uncharacterized protein METZ01_LOCUS149364 [marine metagenome]|uniref:Uncharacterized protein n=1 Tax=marine metagenome TaxID=408172 RepID=A0A382A4Q3_9ZZZZ
MFFTQILLGGVNVIRRKCQVRAKRVLIGGAALGQTQRLEQLETRPLHLEIGEGFTVGLVHFFEQKFQPDFLLIKVDGSVKVRHPNGNMVELDHASGALHESISESTRPSRSCRKDTEQFIF